MGIGPRIQALRRSRGWTQGQLALALKVSRQAVSKWEAGQSMPDGENIVALSRLFGVSTDSLLLGEAVMPASHVDVADVHGEQNRRMGLLLAYMGQAMGLFISLLGLLVIRSQLVAAGGFLIQIFSLLGFQLGYKWFRASLDCRKWRLCYLRGSLWMMALYPCWILTKTAWKLCSQPYNRLTEAATILLVYLMVCWLGDRWLRKKGETKG